MKKIRYKRNRSVKVWHYDPVRYYTPCNGDVESGDLLVDDLGNLYRAQVSAVWGRVLSGELKPRRIKPPNDKMKAVIVDDEIFWVRKGD